MQRLSKKQVLWLALLLAFLTLFFFLDFPLLARSQEQAPIASGTSVYSITANNLTYYAFPLLDVSETTSYRPLWPLVDPPAPASSPSNIPPALSSKEHDPATSGLRTWTNEEVQQLITYWSEYYGIDSAIAQRIAFAESGYRYDAINSSSRACGIFQYVPSVWRNIYEGRAGISCMDADANIRAAIRHMSVHGFSAWSSSQSAWQQ